MKGNLHRRTMVTHNTSRDKPQPVNFILTYSRFLPNLNTILRRHFSILQNDSETKEIFLCPPRVVYRKPKSVRNYLVRARELTSTQDIVFSGCTPCNKPRCLCCDKMVSTNTASASFSSFELKILGNYTCQSKNVVYMIECSICSKQYIGQTSTQFNIRINNHKSHCKTQKHLSISKHVNEEQHHFSNFKYVILKGDFKNDLDRELFESYAIQMFKSKTHGLNEDFGICPDLFA